MKIKSFRIKNYKSIIDSGDCYLSNDDITILAGKNESGKTSILEALEDFDTDKSIRTEAIPITDESAIPTIELNVMFDKKNIKEILESIGITVPSSINKEIGITIIKKYPNNYEIDSKTSDLLNIDNSIKENDNNNEEIISIINQVNDIISKYPELAVNKQEFDFKNDKEIQKKLEDFVNQINSNVNVITIDTEKEQLSKNLSAILELSKTITFDTGKLHKFIEELKRYIPNFILFSSFDDVFPNQVAVSDLDTNEWIKDLSVISNLEVDKIRTTDKQRRSKHVNDININVNGEYAKFWTQDDISIKIENDSQELLFWIYENTYNFKPSQRSKGQQWHLSFYIKVTARAREDVPNILLIDEPGLYLHATAQQDILNKLQDISNNVQVVFSTHSSYLLESANFHRIRLVKKDNGNGTRVFNKIHALADKDTLTPIMTAIGLEINSGIENENRINNVVVEGQSDVYYLNAFKLLLNNTNKSNIVFGGGCGNMPFVGTILHGWGCKVLYLYDNDQGFKDGQTNLQENWYVTELVESICSTKGSIEDIITVADFKKFVLDDEKATYTSSNSEYLKKSRKDKVLLSKLFLEKVKKDKSGITLDTESLKRIKALIKKIDDKFKS